MKVEVGDALPVNEVLVELAPMKTMAAILGDPNPIHWDFRAVSALGMGDRPVNQGPLNMGYIQTMLARWAGGRDRFVDFQVRFLGNVLAGDTVRAGGSVTALREDPVHGLVADCAVHLDVEGGSRALDGAATVRLSEENEQ